MRCLLALLLAAGASCQTPPLCSGPSAIAPAVRDAVQAAGLLSVKLFGASGDGVTDDAEAVQQAIACAFYTGGAVFFPPGWYSFGKTVNLFEDPAPAFGNRSWHGKDVTIKGSNSPPANINGANQTIKMSPAYGSIPPMTHILGPATGPAFRIGVIDTGYDSMQIHGTVGRLPPLPPPSPHLPVPRSPSPLFPRSPHSAHPPAGAHGGPGDQRLRLRPHHLPGGQRLRPQLRILRLRS